MARDENPPFPLGSTFFGGDSTVINATDGFQFEGVEYAFEDIDLTNGTIGAAPYRSNKRKVMRCVRNVNATALLPKQLAKLYTGGTAASNIQGQVNGVGGSAADKCYPADEWLPSTGCLQNDLCWVVVEGMAKVTTAGSGTTTLTVGQVAVPGATGGVVAQDTTTTGANLFNQIQNAIGRAATAVAANSTDFIVAMCVPVP
jgi:hypothetical protein